MQLAHKKSPKPFYLMFIAAGSAALQRALQTLFNIVLIDLTLTQAPTLVV